MENNQNLTLQQEMLARKESAEKSIWNTKMIFEAITVALACILLFGFIKQLFDKDLAWELNGIVVLIAFLVSFLMCNYFYRYCVNHYCGAYRCEKCGHIHFPSKKVTLNADGIFNKTHLECPQCGQKSWQTKMFLNAERSVNQEK